MSNPESRSSVLVSFGANASEVAELLAYNQNVFDHSRLVWPLNLPLPPEIHIAVWREYADEAGQVGTFAALKKRLAQLNFPIREGISQSEAYQAATRRGVPIESLPEATGLILNRPRELDLVIHPSPAGLLPVLIVGDREDFISLVRALLMRNEPKPVPDSMGAAMIAGFNNWDRVRRHREKWESDHPGGDWAEGFQELIPHKELYQDRFMLLSRGPYSAVSAKDLGLVEEEWRRLSLAIRLEHECTHYFSRRLFSSMRNNLIDELIADYAGIVAATGRYRADWFLRFMGLEAFPACRPDGRLHNYRGDPPLSDGAFTVLQALVEAAAKNLEQFDHAHRVESEKAESGLMLIALTCLTVEELASEQAVTILQETWDQVRRMNHYVSTESLS